MYMYLHACVYVHVYVCMYINVYMYVYACTHKKKCHEKPIFTNLKKKIRAHRASSKTTTQFSYEVIKATSIKYVCVCIYVYVHIYVHFFGSECCVHFRTAVLSTSACAVICVIQMFLGHLRTLFLMRTVALYIVCLTGLR